MALSNILKEPRREITETLVGLVTVGIALYAYSIVVRVLIAHFDPMARGQDYVFDVVMGTIIAVPVSMIMVGLFMLTHAIGDGICESLEQHGIRLRPTQRYR